MRRYCGQNYFDDKLRMIVMDCHTRVGECLPHTHDFLELVYVFSGKGIHVVDGMEQEVHKGSVVVINPDQVHSFKSQDGHTIMNFLIDPSFLGGGLDSDSDFSDVKRRYGCLSQEKATSFYQLATKDIVFAEHLCNSMNDEIKRKSVEFESVLLACMQAFVSLIIRSESAEINSKKSVWGDVIEFIDQHFSEKITIELIAKNFFFNPAYLGRAFRDYYKMSIKDYIKEKRIKQALELLIETSMTVESIAAQVGYASRTRFYADFEEIIGKRPNNVRKDIK